MPRSTPPRKRRNASTASGQSPMNSTSSSPTAPAAPMRILPETAFNALKMSVAVPSDKIKITVSSGWVTLEGEVEWQYQKTAAENTVRYISGVVGFSDNIRVKPRTTPVGAQEQDRP